MMQSTEFKIQADTEVIFVSDFFVHDYQGGAELTSETYIECCPKKLVKLYARGLTKELVLGNKDKKWVFGNWTSAPLDALAQLVVSECDYSIIEYDYKICKYRSPQLHQIQENKACDCLIGKKMGPYGPFVDNFYARAKNIFFMSEQQRQYYINNTSVFRKNAHKNSLVLGSAWPEVDLQFLITKYNNRVKNGIKKPNTYAILSGGTWIKNQKGCEEFCKNNNISYELVGNLPHGAFLDKLSEYEGLVFLPAGFDTAPRIVIEAKIMGLNLHLNDFVQHQHEEWFAGDVSDMLDHLRTRKNVLWRNIFLT